MKVTVKNVQHGLKTSTNVGYNRITFMENNIFLDTASYLYKGAPEVLKLLKGLEPNDEVDLMWHRPNKACIATSITIIGNKQDLISNNTENTTMKVNTTTAQDVWTPASGMSLAQFKANVLGITLEAATDSLDGIDESIELMTEHYNNTTAYKGMNIMVDESIYAEVV